LIVSVQKQWFVKGVNAKHVSKMCQFDVLINKYKHNKGGRLWELNQVQKELLKQRGNPTGDNEIIRILLEIRHH
jgi:hypothetical protein